MVIFLFDLILLFNNHCLSNYKASGKQQKIKINDNHHVKTVTSKCTALSIKQRQEAGKSNHTYST